MNQYVQIALMICALGVAMVLYPQVGMAKAMQQDEVNELTVILKPDSRLDAALMFEEALHASWVPSLQDISKVESVIQKKLEEVRPVLAEKWQGYMRQYIGASDKEGGQYVYGNFLCDVHGDWKNDLVRVMDGGDCYFQAVVDVKAQKVKHMMINGEA